MLSALLAALRDPECPFEILPLEDPQRLVAAQVLFLADQSGDARARPALRALGGELAEVLLNER